MKLGGRLAGAACALFAPPLAVAMACGSDETARPTTPDASVVDAHDERPTTFDVVEPEPYPPDGPLWSTPNTILVPHMAGGVAHGSDALFNDNLARLRAGRPLRNAVER